MDSESIIMFPIASTIFILSHKPYIEEILGCPWE